MRQSKKDGSLEPFDFDSLLKQIPELSFLDCTIETHSFGDPVDSSNMTPDHWIRLGQIIEEEYHNHDGFVILHGTDTMAFTASALSFLLENLNKPVILTGSQLPIGILRSDARENLINSVEIAARKNSDGKSTVKEVAVYFEYKLYRGNRVFKNSSENFDAFKSPNYPELAEAGVKLKFNSYALYPEQSGMFHAHTRMENKVGVVRVFPGLTEEVFRAMVLAPVKGIIIHTFGAGNVPNAPWFFDVIREALENGVCVANVTQCRSGGVTPGLYAAGKELQNLGVLNSGDMTIEAALTKMMFLLARNLPIKTLKKLYEHPIKGELGAP
jgi:L-asparaginase